MAIKGKRKPKARGGRVVTAGPRPAYVPPKVPPFQRTGAKFLIVLIIEAAIFALLVGFGEQSKADRQRETIREFTTLVDAALFSEGTAIQQVPGGAEVLAQLPTRMSEVEEGAAPDPDAVAEEAEGWSDSVTGAADAVLGVQADFQVLDLEQRRAMGTARDLIERGLRVYAGIADQLAVAAMIDGRPQADLLASMREQLTVAAATFQSGYTRLQDVRTEAGLPTAEGVPGGGFPPGFDPTMPGQLPPGFDPTMPGQLPPGFDPTMPDTQVVPADPEGDGGGGGDGGGNG